MRGSRRGVSATAADGVDGVAGATPGAPSPVRAWAVTLLMMLLLVVNFGDKSVLGLAAAGIKADLDLSASGYGAIASSTFFLFSLSSLLVGFLTVRFPVKWILVVLATVWALVQLPVAIFATVPVLWFSRIALGAAEGPTTGLVTHATQMWFPPDKRSVPTGLCTIGAQVGSATAAPLLTLVIVAYGWRAAFVVLGVGGLVVALVWALAGANGPYGGAGARPVGPTSGTPVAGEPHVPYRKLLTSGSFLGTVLSGFAVYGAGTLSGSWLPYYLHEVVGYSVTAAGSLVALPPLVGAASVLGGTALSGRLIRRGVTTRLARGVLGAGVVLLSGCCLLGFTFSGHGWWSVVLMCGAFGVPTLTFPLDYAGLAEVAPVHQRGVVLSTALAIITFSGLFAPYVSGVLVDHAPDQATGFAWGFVGVAVVALVTGTFALFAVRPDRDGRRFGMPPIRPVRTSPDGGSPA